MIQQEMPFKDISYLQLWWPFCSAEWNHWCVFARGHFEMYVKLISSLGGDVV